MAPKILISSALVLAGVFAINIPAVCLAQFADGSGINIEKQVHKVLITGQQIETKPVSTITLRYRRSAIFSSSSRAMYADNMETIAVNEKQG